MPLPRVVEMEGSNGLWQLRLSALTMWMTLTAFYMSEMKKKGEKWSISICCEASLGKQELCLMSSNCVP